MIPAVVQQKKYKALIDTGASRSCMSEKSYHELQLPPLSELFAIRVTSATGTPIKELGTIKCPVTWETNSTIILLWYVKILGDP